MSFARETKPLRLPVKANGRQARFKQETLNNFIAKN
jgi:hypothetical protein